MLISYLIIINFVYFLERSKVLDIDKISKYIIILYRLRITVLNNKHVIYL